ncbi:hypothetical protein P872_04425 [Rhodonellum psychrophilum GCM71 = DSM 17998]|uniref:Tagaturonate reductase n=2 Tax=Rhodonellum TaxID=336827 RepID=U5BYW7_9BACT|nr:MULTISPECIES: tagaturonate reductase [Rhodonellum]ERM82769.1 hypothetical protein P872_04425 [Rhodonellum psychrophilum GCM71 = DSM 17998]SDZ28383.1 tagaturonate reductase [Rhodonellum ikkaensis]
MKNLNRQNIDTAKRPVKILQFGEGNFLRGFVDWMVDVMNEKTSFDGDVVVVQPIAQGLAEMLKAQDGLYHVLLQGIQNGKPTQESRLITCIQEAMNPFEDYAAYLELGENPDLRFVISNTTEAGITFDPEDKEHQSIPLTFPGKLTALLFKRFQTFNGDPKKGLVLIPCELIDKNGAILKECILKYAKLWHLSEAFSSWIEEANSFCNTLVDRIVPGFPRETIGEIQEELGYEDNLVVMAEPFHLWVIEGPEGLEKEFPAAQAGLQVKFVKDQNPYRTRKVRILNGAHTALVPVAFLKGFRTVRESVEDPEMGEFIKATIFGEIIPTLDLPKEELEQFANDVLDRFRNPFIRHELVSISLNSISKFKVRVLPSILEYHRIKGIWPAHLIQSFAALIAFYKGEINGEPIPLKDDEPVMAFFKEVWKEENLETVVEKTLGRIDFWGMDLSQLEGLKDAVLGNLKESTVES